MAARLAQLELGADSTTAATTSNGDGAVRADSLQTMLVQVMTESGRRRGVGVG